MVKSALIEAKKLLDFYIESTDDLDTEQTESVKHFIKALRAGCGCDDYNGFDCGCGKRDILCEEALKELDGGTSHKSVCHCKTNKWWKVYFKGDKCKDCGNVIGQ